MIFWEKQKKIKALYELYTKPLRDKYDLTQMEYKILTFLHRNPTYDTAASIIRVTQLTKSHVSAAVKKLEEYELVMGVYENNNRKEIHLKLTPKAEKILEEGSIVSEKYVNSLFSGFSEKEIQQMKEYFERVSNNAEAEINRICEDDTDA